MNVYQPLRRSLVAIGVTVAIVAGAQAMAQISADGASASSLPTIASVSVAPTCVADARHGGTRVCYQANVVVGEPERINAGVARVAR